METETGSAKLFDFSDKSSDDVGRTVLCPNENEAYDLTAKVCRPFSLEITGRNGVYKPDNSSGKTFSCGFSKCLSFIFAREE